MPPLPLWCGDFKLTGTHAPHECDWVGYIDGDQAARAPTRHELETALVQVLANMK